MASRPVDHVNLYGPLLDLADNAGNTGDVLQSMGPTAAPVWRSTGACSSPASPSSPDPNIATSGTLLNWGTTAPFGGRVVLTAPSAAALDVMLLHIIGMTHSNKQNEQGCFDCLLQVDFDGAKNIRIATVQGVAPDLPIHVGWDPVTGNFAVLIGTTTSVYDGAFFTIARGWFQGPAAAAYATSWKGSGLKAGSYSEEPVQPIGWTKALGGIDTTVTLATGKINPLSGSAGRISSDLSGGQLSLGLGSASYTGTVTGALVFLLPEKLAQISVVQLVGVGPATNRTVNCWITLERGPAENDPIVRIEVLNHAPYSAPIIQAGRTTVGNHNVLTIGDAGTIWKQMALAFTISVFSQKTERQKRPLWLTQITGDMAQFMLTATAITDNAVYVGSNNKLPALDGSQLTNLPVGPAAPGGVTSVNSKTGDVTLTATDVGAVPAGSAVLTLLAGNSRALTVTSAGTTRTIELTPENLPPLP